MKTKHWPLVKSLMTLSLISLVGCSSLPPPEGNLCVIDVKANGATCVSIVPQASGGNQTNAAVFIPFNTMDNYVAVSPETWANIQVYIQALKAMAKKQMGQ